MKIISGSCPKPFSSFFSCPDTMSGVCLSNTDLSSCIDKCVHDPECYLGSYITHEGSDSRWCQLFAKSHISNQYPPETFIGKCTYPYDGFTFFKDTIVNTIYSDTQIQLRNEGQIFNTEFGISEGEQDALLFFFRPISITQYVRSSLWNENAIFIIDAITQQKLAYDAKAQAFTWTDYDTSISESTHSQPNVEKLWSVYFVMIDPVDRVLNDQSSIRLFISDKSPSDDLSDQLRFPIVVKNDIIFVGNINEPAALWRPHVINSHQMNDTINPSFWKDDRATVFRHLNMPASHRSNYIYVLLTMIVICILLICWMLFF